MLRARKMGSFPTLSFLPPKGEVLFVPRIPSTNYNEINHYNKCEKISVIDQCKTNSPWDYYCFGAEGWLIGTAGEFQIIAIPRYFTASFGVKELLRAYGENYLDKYLEDLIKINGHLTTTWYKVRKDQIKFLPYITVLMDGCKYREV